MAKEKLTGAQKLQACVQYIQRSGVAHTFKDLEKALPQVSTINGMQVKDYVQMMTDENLIRVEKIGSGNWYWSFLSDEKMKKEGALSKAEVEKLCAEKVVEGLRARIEDAEAERDEEEEMLEGGGLGRQELMETQALLSRDLEALKIEMVAYSDNDPIEVESRREKIRQASARIVALTDAICSIEGYFKNTGGMDKVQLLGLKQSLYGTEYDTEAGGLRDI